MAEQQITKRRVTMARYSTIVLNGEPQLVKEEAVDYVRPDHLDAYVADARTKWQSVDVSDEPDAGPAGYHGETVVPGHLALPDAGMTYPATDDQEG